MFKHSPCLGTTKIMEKRYPIFKICKTIVKPDDFFLLGQVCQKANSKFGSESRAIKYF